MDPLNVIEFAERYLEENASNGRYAGTESSTLLRASEAYEDDFLAT
jgi:hypothetical protein